MTTEETTQTDAAVIAELAERAATATEVIAGAVDEFVLGDGQKVEIVDHEKLLDRPRRRRGTRVALDADSFSMLVGDLGPEHGRSAIYADITALKLTAVLNDDEAGDDELDLAGWRDHRVELSIVRTPQWERWLSRHDKIGEQAAFAQHLEENLPDIVDPDPADLLELAQSFEATIGAEFKSASRLSNGARQFTYVETIDARAGRDGQITVPEGFAILVPPVEGADPVTVRAKLRYRLSGGELRIGYVLEDPQGVERKAFDDVVAKVATSTSITPYSAKAPASS